jgi:biopolymer transport protein ExbD
MTMNDNAVRGLSSEINVTPLIDVLLVLLIIFMVIVPVMPRGEVAAVPSPSGQNASEKAVVLEVLGGKDGAVTYKLNQVAITKVDLSARLVDIFRSRSNKVLFVMGDDQVAFNRITDVIDLGHNAGVQDVGILTPGTKH